MGCFEFLFGSKSSPAFRIFVEEYSDRLEKEGNYEIGAGDLKEARKLWKKLSSEEKLRYRLIAEERKLSNTLFNYISLFH